MDEVYKQIVNIAKKYNTKKVVLFGSRARGTNHPKSDIDLAIYGCEDFGDLSDCLNEELWSLLKLFAVLGLLLGKTLITQLLIVSLVTGGITGVVELCIKKTGRVELGMSHVQMHGFHYAVAILMAYVVVFCKG